MIYRSSQEASGHTALDKSLTKKKGLPRPYDYLVKTANPLQGPKVFTFTADSRFPPTASVDQTIQLPPDSDGNFYNTPRDGFQDNLPPSEGYVTPVPLAIASAPAAGSS